MSQFKVSNLCNITKFDGTYLDVWKYNIKLVLKSEILLRINEGLEIEYVSSLATPSGIIHHLPPTKPRSKNEFQKMIHITIIANHLNNSQVSHISYCNISKEAWDNLGCLFEVHDLVTKMYLMKQLTMLKMKENENVTKHVHNFKSLLKQLSIVGNPMKEEDVVLTLMQNMSPSYQSFFISIRGQTFTLQTLITHLIQEETLLKSLDCNVEAITIGSMALAFK
jgi:hypothetical protein